MKNWRGTSSEKLNFGGLVPQANGSLTSELDSNQDQTKEQWIAPIEINEQLALEVLATLLMDLPSF